MEEQNLETTKCVSCGESVLPAENFCKNCGKPLEQKNEKIVNAVKENPNKKVLLTFEALDDKSIKNGYGQDIKYTYSIEVDGNFIGKINAGEKIDTFVTKGKHNIVLKCNRTIIPTEEQIWVEDNQTILLYNKCSYGFYFLAFQTNPSDLEKEEILQENKKARKKAFKFAWIFVAVSVLAFLTFLLVAFNEDLRNEFIGERTGRSVNIESSNNQNEQIVHFNYMASWEEGFEALNVKIIFGKEEIRVVFPDRTVTYIIVGEPVDCPFFDDCIVYYVYRSNDADKNIKEFRRCEDRVHIRLRRDGVFLYSFDKYIPTPPPPPPPPSAEQILRQQSFTLETLPLDFQEFFRNFTRNRETQISLINNPLIFNSEYIDNVNLKKNWEFTQKEFFREGTFFIEKAIFGEYVFFVETSSYTDTARERWWGSWRKNDNNTIIYRRSFVAECYDEGRFAFEEFTFKKINNRWSLVEYENDDSPICWRDRL